MVRERYKTTYREDFYMITKSPNYSWKAHHLADIDFTWDGRWFPDREIARGQGDHRHEMERALGVHILKRQEHKV